MDKNKNPVTISEESTTSARDFYKKRPVWLDAVARILLGMILIVALVLIGRTIHHHLKHNQVSIKQGGQQVSKKSDTAKPNTTKSAQASQNGSATSPQGSTTNPQAASQLPNSGPGDTLAIFVSVSLLAAGVHSVVSRHKAKV